LIETPAFKWSIEELADIAFEVLLFSIHRGPHKGLVSSKCSDLKD